MFGLSYQEFLDEPLDIYVVNQRITGIQNDLERKDLKKQETKARMSRR